MTTVPPSETFLQRVGGCCIQMQMRRNYVSNKTASCARQWLSPSSVNGRPDIKFLMGQILSAGAVYQNLLVAASLAGFAAQWLTEWYTYDAHIQSLFNIGDHEDIAGFVYLGSAEKRPDERARPDKHTRIQRWQQPR